MKKFILLLSLFLIASCQQKHIIPAPSRADFVQHQTGNWKRQLLLNGDVGKQCTGDTDKWSAENPGRFYGLPNGPIKSKSFDANNDKIEDLLLYFEAGDCCNCEMGTNEASDYLTLIYSNGKEFLYNDTLREKIAYKIETEFYAQTNNDVEHVVFSVTNFNKEISGTYKLWTLEDPDCCASVEGAFNYNPFTFNVQITHKKVN